MLYDYFRNAITFKHNLSGKSYNYNLVEYLIETNCEVKYLFVNLLVVEL